jgi:hypothetical protein
MENWSQWTELKPRRFLNPLHIWQTSGADYLLLKNFFLHTPEQRSVVWPQLLTGSFEISSYAVLTSSPDKLSLHLSYANSYAEFVPFPS